MTASTADHSQSSAQLLTEQPRIATLTEGGHTAAFAQLLIFGFHGPLLWLAANLRNGASSRDTLLVAGASVAVALSVYSLISRISITRHRALAATSALLLAFWHWESLSLPLLGIPSEIGALVLSGALVATAYLNAERRLFRLAFFWVGAALFAVSVILTAVRMYPATASTVSTRDPAFVATIDRAPDVYFVVLDGYARSDVLQEIYGFDNRVFEGMLRSNGFEVAENATANYSVTHFSLASTLGMDYVIDPTRNVTQSDLQALRRTLVEDNATL
ncbi:MAG TPA: hypothetical protein VJ938_01925, partial [Acidimicrobiia bacterium]|nr:hypothetical protein [Acidimicrobiia bacterium]